jgi:hypothetical protein
MIMNKIPSLLLEPDQYLQPTIHMSPFTGKMASFLNKKVNKNDFIEELSLELFGEVRQGELTVNGREAILIALRLLELKKESVISIITSSNCGYVSSCVTTEISKICNYIIGYTDTADVYFLIHEFGRVAVLPKEVTQSGKPIIEDCAYGLVSMSYSSLYGSIGDYIIYSLPKAFSIQFGGAIFTKKKFKNNIVSNLMEKDSDYIICLLNESLPYLINMNERRVELYRKMKSLAKSYGFFEVLSPSEYDVPHAFLVGISDLINQEKIKKHLNSKGIESSVFYGGGGYFIPCHYKLNEWELEYMFYHLNSAINKYSVKNGK